jgi:copper(I)-binding protein
MLRTILFAGVTAFVSTLSAVPVLADIIVTDPYARASTAMSESGAAFMVIENTGAEDVRLIVANSDIAERVELHTHKESANGVMQMMEVEGGFVIPAGGTHKLARGGDHIMFLGLTRPMVDGETFPLTLVFENAGEVVIDIPVDLTRKPMHGAGMMQHGKHGMTN